MRLQLYAETGIFKRLKTGKGEARVDREKPATLPLLDNRKFGADRLGRIRP